jgi:hypothetical protein
MRSKNIEIRKGSTQKKERLALRPGPELAQARQCTRKGHLKSKKDNGSS